MSYTVIIPARYASTRLPGKPLLEIHGKSLIQHVYESACNSKARRVIIATDDLKVYDAVAAFGAEGVMTSVRHRSGTERISEAVELCGLPQDETVVNVQGDEFALPASLIDQLAGLLPDPATAQMATLCEPLEDSQAIADPNVVKVVRAADGTALYFSRAPIPWSHTDDGPPCHYYRHIGLYAYKVSMLRDFARLEVSILEQREKLEQLRALYHGWRILLGVADEPPGIGVDTPADLQRCRRRADGPP